MAVITRLKTNASEEEIKDAVSGYNTDVTLYEEGIFDIYMASYDRYTLLCENANDCLLDNLRYEFDKTKKKLEFEILKTNLE